MRKLSNSMMRWLNRHVASPAGPVGRWVERVRGTSILTAYDELKRSDRWDRDQLQRFKDQKVRALVAHIERHCPWYVRQWEQAGIQPADIRGEADLQRLPVLTKEQFREAQHNGLVAANVDELGASMTASGGTTGAPVQLAVGGQSRSYAGAAVLRYYHWWGCGLEDPKGVLWGRADPAGKPLRARAVLALKDFLSQRLALNTFTIDDAILADYYQRLYSFDPPVLRGYANSLALFARHVEQHKHPNWPALRMISSTSERLTDEMRERIEATFGKPVSNQYGFGEVNGVAFECPEGRRMHVAEEHALLETVDSHGRRVWGEEGRLVVTDLDNFATPLLRYEMGDVGIMQRDGCSCGRQHHVLDQIVGRLSEALALANGRQIAPSYWSVVLRPYPEIEQACVRVMTDAHLQIDLKLSRPLDEQVTRHLHREVDEAVGDDVRVEWRVVDRIPPVRSGKFPWVRRVEDERMPVGSERE